MTQEKRSFVAAAVPAARLSGGGDTPATQVS